MRGLYHEGADLRRCDLREEFRDLPISSTRYDHFDDAAQARINRRGYGYIQNAQLDTYNRIHAAQLVKETS